MFNDVFRNLSVELCDELNHDFLELFKSTTEVDPDDDVVQAITYNLYVYNYPIFVDMCLMHIHTLLSGVYSARGIKVEVRGGRKMAGRRRKDFGR